ncbi:MAG TPA: PEP-CTERM sorting domain-containing protein [Tepidisphaeraceae bacterium]|nr:PEP-CTERM sorting domain-containing protein [Tepidisphaeraceae bacterium]
MTCRMARLGILGLLAGLGASPALAGVSIGINFVNTSDGGVQDSQAASLGANEQAGAPGYEQANWNNLGRWGQSVALKASSGAASGVSATWDSANTWNTGANTGTPNGKLMNGYIDATGQANNNSTPYQFWWNENKPEVYVKGLGQWLAAQNASSYQVVVYTDGDVAEGRQSEYWLQSVSDSNDPPQALGGDLSSHVFVSDTANFSGTFTQVPLAANSLEAAGTGNYMVFTGLTADSFVLRTEEHTFRACINGLQIVAVPEPVSIGLLGVGALGFLARRRGA